MDIIQKLRDNQKNCTGCSACVNRCPKSALTMEPNLQGFLYPVVDQEKCINCGLCVEVCPKLNPVDDNTPEPQCFAACAEDNVRIGSSSGGVFPLLAEQMLKRGGIVCGAVLDGSFNVMHICSDSPKEIERMRKSKYVQSGMGAIHKEILDYLKAGRDVLFTGCPCQVASVKSFCRDYLEHLYLVDILCTGVSSPQEWQDFLQSRFEPSTIEHIDFRDKQNGWRCDMLSVYKKDGSKEILLPDDAIYSKALLSHLTTRDGCDKCDFGGLRRQGDLTIGDFWGIWEIDPSMADGNGTGLILSNNEKGQFMLKQIFPFFKKIKEFPVSKTIGRNRVHIITKQHPYHERFKELYPLKGFEMAVTDAFSGKHDIGLVSIFSCPNYGGQFTQFALYHVLKEMGYSVLMIEANNRRTMDIINGRCLFENNPYPDYDKAAGAGELHYLNDQCRVFIVGSDQHFNMEIMHKIGTSASLDFVENRRAKIGYAISFGHDYFNGTDSERAYLSNMFRKFDALSVREDTSVSLCENDFGVEDAVHVLDPVFLLDSDTYNSLADTFKNQMPGEPFVYGFILDPFEKEPILRFLEGYFDMSSRTVPDIIYVGTDDITKAYPFYTDNKARLEKWLGFFKFSNFVFTDSFHGTCMALLFHKEFVSFYDPKRGNSRLESLLKPLGLEERMISSLQDLQKRIGSFSPIDWERVDAVLEIQVDFSKQWLKDQISKYVDIKRPLSDLDIMTERYRRQTELLNNNLQAVSNATRYQAKVFEEKIQSLTEEIALLHKNLNDIETHNLSNKVIRKTKGGIRCLKDHGMIYTVKRLAFHVDRYIQYLRSI